MLFALWNAAHYSIIAVAFIRNGFYFIYYIVFIYSNDARARLSYFGACARPLPAPPVSGLSVQAPPQKPARNNSDRTKIFLYYKKTEFYCILLKMLYICAKTLFAMLITHDPEKEKDVIRFRFRLFTRFFLLCISLWLIAVVILAFIQ